MGTYSIAPDAAGSPPYIRAPSRRKAHPEFCRLKEFCDSGAAAQPWLYCLRAPACRRTEATVAYCCGARPRSILLDPPYPTLFLFFLFYHTLTLGLQRSTNPPTLATSGYVFEVV